MTRSAPVLTAGILLALAGGPRCVSQEPRLAVTGGVTDSGTGQPICGARVEDDGYGSSPCRGATTDSLGSYRYLTWPEEHTIVAAAPGYVSERRTLLTGLLSRDTLKVISCRLRPN